MLLLELAFFLGLLHHFQMLFVTNRCLLALLIATSFLVECLLQLPGLFPDACLDYLVSDIILDTLAEEAGPKFQQVYLLVPLEGLDAIVWILLVFKHFILGLFEYLIYFV